MAFSYPTYIFIIPNETKLLVFNDNGINLTDPDGTNPTQVASGLFQSHYMYDDVTGFIYVINKSDGNLYRNTTTLDFTSFSDLGNIVTAGSYSPPRIIKVNNSRILYASAQEMHYTDNVFSSSTSITVPEETNLRELLYEGGDNVMCIYDNGFSTETVYRSINNGLNWTLQFTENSVFFGPGIKI